MRIISPFLNSCNGLRLAWAEDRSFRHAVIQTLIGVILATLLVEIYNKSVFSWLFLVASLFPVLIVETINSSIEAITDKASPERHPLAKKAKDIGSAAVLLTRCLALLCWVTIWLAYAV